MITQAVMAAVLIAAAATIGQAHAGAAACEPEHHRRHQQDAGSGFGADVGRVVFGFGTIGAAMVAAIVVSLASAWGFGEVTGYRHSLEHHPLEAPWFYGIYSVAVIGGAVVVDLVPNLVALNIAVQVMNALMLPLVLGFLVLLAFKALPPEHRLKGPTPGWSSWCRYSPPGWAFMAASPEPTSFEALDPGILPGPAPPPAAAGHILCLGCVQRYCACRRTFMSET